MSSFFFFNDTATTEIYTLSLHDALPIWTVSNINCTMPTSWSTLIRQKLQSHTIYRLSRLIQILQRSEEHTSELQSPCNLVCRLLLEKKKCPNRSPAIALSKGRSLTHADH